MRQLEPPHLNCSHPQRSSSVLNGRETRADRDGGYHGVIEGSFTVRIGHQRIAVTVRTQLDSD